MLEKGLGGYTPKEYLKKGVTLAASIKSGYIPENDGTHTFRVLRGVNKGKLMSTRQPEQGFAMGNYEPEVTRAIAEVLKEGDTFFDVGANVGWDTLIASQKVGQNGKVIAFEPGEGNLDLLGRNVRRNRLYNTQIEPFGVGERTGTLQFAEYGYGLVNHVITPEHPAADDANITSINLVSIDDYVHASGNVPNVLKIDVEGFESAVLHGAQKTLETHKPSVICEVRKDNWGEIKDYMEDLGYSHEFLGGNGRGLETAGLDDVLFIAE